MASHHDLYSQQLTEPGKPAFLKQALTCILQLASALEQPVPSSKSGRFLLHQLPQPYSHDGGSVYVVVQSALDVVVLVLEVVLVHEVDEVVGLVVVVLLHEVDVVDEVVHVVVVLDEVVLVVLVVDVVDEDCAPPHGSSDSMSLAR